MQGVRYFYDPANKRARASRSWSTTTNTKPEDAAKTYDFLHAAKYYSTTGTASPADMQRVVDAIVKTGDVKPPAPALSRWVDFKYMERANAELAGHR